MSQHAFLTAVAAILFSVTTQGGAMARDAGERTLSGAEVIVAVAETPLASEKNTRRRALPDAPSDSVEHLPVETDENVSGRNLGRPD
jgi:hypothetical protein